MREKLLRPILQTPTRVPNKKGHTRRGASLTFRSILGRSSLDKLTMNDLVHFDLNSSLWRRHRARQGQPVIGAILTNHRLRRL